MKKIIILLLILYPFVLFSQVNQTDANGLRQGLWKKEQPNGKLIYEGYFKDGNPVGEWNRFHEGGQIKAIINYSEKSDSAFAQLFDIRRNLVAEGNYLNEKKEGIWVLFSKNLKIAEEQYLNGLKHGVFKKFYDSGELLEEADWVNGKKEGKYQAFYKNGKPFIQCKYSNNMRNGIFYSLFQDGRTEIEAFYKNNLRHGEWKYNNEKGELLYILNYNEGELLNPEVRDSIENLEMQNLEKGKDSILDPEKFMADPSEYMMKQGLLK